MSSSTPPSGSHRPFHRSFLSDSSLFSCRDPSFPTRPPPPIPPIGSVRFDPGGPGSIPFTGSLSFSFPTGRAGASGGNRGGGAWVMKRERTCPQKIRSPWIWMGPDRKTHAPKHPPSSAHFVPNPAKRRSHTPSLCRTSFVARTGLLGRRSLIPHFPGSIPARSPRFGRDLRRRRARGACGRCATQLCGDGDGHDTCDGAAFVTRQLADDASEARENVPQTPADPHEAPAPPDVRGGACRERSTDEHVRMWTCGKSKMA